MQIEQSHWSDGSPSVRNGPEAKHQRVPRVEFSKLCMNFTAGRSEKESVSSWFSEMGFSAGGGKKAESIIRFCFSAYK
jgi:hypothetical protein